MYHNSQYQNTDIKGLEDMIYISMDQDHATNRLQMVEANGGLWVGKNRVLVMASLEGYVQQRLWEVGVSVTNWKKSENIPWLFESIWLERLLKSKSPGHEKLRFEAMLCY